MKYSKAFMEFPLTFCAIFIAFSHQKQRQKEQRNKWKEKAKIASHKQNKKILLDLCNANQSFPAVFHSSGFVEFHYFR